MICSLALLAVTPAHTEAMTSAAAGAFGGASIPIVQEDNGIGGQFGVRLPVNLLPYLTLEPFFAQSFLGNATDTFGGVEYSRSGYDVTAFGVNVVLGSLGLMPWFPLYPYGGIASNMLSRTGSDDIAEVGLEFGLGAGFAVTQVVSMDLRGGLNTVITDETSRKFINATVGIYYRFLPWVK